MQIDTSKATGAIGNIFTGIKGVLLGQSSDGWSRKWLLVLGVGLVAWKLPGFVMPSWLQHIILVWLGGQSLADAAEAYAAKNAPPAPPAAPQA